MILKTIKIETKYYLRLLTLIAVNYAYFITYTLIPQMIELFMFTENELFMITVD